MTIKSVKLIRVINGRRCTMYRVHSLILIGPMRTLEDSPVQFTLNQKKRKFMPDEQFSTRILITPCAIQDFFSVLNFYDLRMSNNSYLYCITQKIISTRDRPRLIFCPFTLPLLDFGQKRFFICFPLWLTTLQPFHLHYFGWMRALVLVNYYLIMTKAFCLCRHNGRQALYEK